MAGLSHQEIINQIEQNSFTPDLIIGGEEKIELIRISAGDKNYYMALGELKKQLAAEGAYLLLYGDYPAINSGLMGTIIQIDDVEITTHSQLAKVMQDYSPGQEVKVKTRVNLYIKYKPHIMEEFIAYGSPELEISGKGLIIRKSNIINEKTLLIKADKSAKDLSDEFVKELQNPNNQVIMEIEIIGNYETLDSFNMLKSF